MDFAKINGDFPEADFWPVWIFPGSTSELAVIRD